MPGSKSRSAKGRIVVLGGINMDIVVVAEAMPDTGEYMYGKELHFIPGGNGLNQAVVAARLGSAVAFVGFVGNDSFGEELARFLKKENVGTAKLQVLDASHSGTVLFILTGGVERHFVFPGSNMEASIKDLPDMNIEKSDIVVSQLTVPQEIIIALFKKARKAGARTMLNLFPNYDVSNELMRLSDYVILNEVELAFRSGERSFVKAQHKDLQMNPNTVMNRAKEIRASDSQIIITTLADRGVIGIRQDKMSIVKGIRVKFVDATGAGDCFLGAFATALAEKMGFDEALRFANCAAAISVQKIGATTSFPGRGEVDSFVKKQSGAI